MISLKKRIELILKIAGRNIHVGGMVNANPHVNEQHLRRFVLNAETLFH